MSFRVKIVLVALIAVAVLLRFHGFLFNTFHPDEALFAFWSRLIAVGRDPLLVDQAVDKPPLLFYLQALFYPLFGPVEWAARVPNFAASVMLIPATGLLAWRLFRQELVVVLGAGFVAFSPLTIQFSGTAFTDPLLAFWLTMSLVAISYSVSLRFFGSDVGFGFDTKSTRRSALFGGIFFGLAIATKYQAWLFLPLALGLAYVGNWRWHQWKRWLAGVLICLTIVLLWEIVRSGSFTLVNEQLSSFGGLRISYSWELWPRLEAWARQWRFVLDSQVLSFLVLLSMPLYLALLIHDDDKTTAIDQMLVIFLIAYFIFHWFLAIPVWDRYLLPLLPLVGIVLARFILRVFFFIEAELPSLADHGPLIRRVIWIIPLILLLLQGKGILDAYAGRLPIGGQPGADQGISLLTSEFDQAPYGTVLYDHWYSWQLRYYLFESRAFISWFPDIQQLQKDLLVFGHDGNARYLIVPDTKVSAPILRAVADSGFRLTEVNQSSPILSGLPSTLYLIEPR